MKKVAVSIAALVLAGFIGAVQAAGSAAAGKNKVAVCQSCHGGNGISVNPTWPSLAGQNAGYIAKQLADFKSGKRKNATMAPMTAALSKKDMADIGAYYAELKPPVNTASSKKLAGRGQRLYRGGNAKMGVSACMSCHGPGGHGIPPRFPRVSGQHATYAKNQLLAFKSGKRSNDDEIMTRIAFRMSENEIEAVSQYMAGLR